MTHARRWAAGGLVLCGMAVILGGSEPAAAFGRKPAAPPPAQEEEKIDYVGLAARLIKDHHPDRAEVTLEQVDLKDPSVDLVRFHTLNGMVKLELKKYKEARDQFQKAIAAGQTEKVIFVYLAQAHHGLQDYQGVVGGLNKAGSAGKKTAGTFLLRSNAHWELKQYNQAIAALDEGARKFPEEHEFTRLKIFYLIDLGLFQEVSRIGEKYLAREGSGPEDYAAVGEGLRRSNQFDAARKVLEAARLRYPENEKILLLLAHSYLDDGHPLIAAMLFEEAARNNQKYSLEAAELYLKAGRMERALANNERVIDQKAKMKQRLSILLRMERFSMVSGMEPRLSRLGLLSDENIRYALAYGYFKTGDFKKAEAQLKQLTEAKHFESATQLRKAMEACKQSGWEC